MEKIVEFEAENRTSWSGGGGGGGGTRETREKGHQLHTYIKHTQFIRAGTTQY